MKKMLKEKEAKANKMGAGKYAAAPKKMADGGYNKSKGGMYMMADGGPVCGHRSKQDYGK